ncbi:hypothetical protein BASA50_004472 [Batrachochytrium salamandrivorans]|uniref:Uncharacterized protein n=2 Tax=Batrachochytrium salamandrivorans TaxID=1357716 RepID=A0ABQ8FFI8_9FUNG|nr:hypothetical protein BASA50_004472 [Batrachochytrium salamandrivorans]
MSHAPTPSKGSPKPLSEAPVSCPFTPSPIPKKGTPIGVHSNLRSTKRSPIIKPSSAKRPRNSPISRPTTMSMLDEMSRVLEKTSQEHREFEKTMINKLDTLTDNVSQQILSLVSSFQTTLSSIEAKVDSLVQGVDIVRTEVEGTRVDIDTVVEGADSEMCSVKEYLKAVASSSAIIMSKLEVLGSSPHVPQFLNQPSYAMMASHPPVNTPTTRTAVRKPSAVTVAAPESLVPPVKITRGGILNTPLPTMSHQAARVLLRTEPEQQASVAARFQKHQAATRSQILPPAALPDIENAHKCRILILQMPRTMPFKEVRDILRPFCTTNCIWDMCWLDSTRLQIIIDDHEVMRLRGSAFQLGNITCAAIADPRAAPFPSATAEEKNISLKIWVGKQVQTILRPATLPRTRKFLYDAIQASGEVAVQHAAKLAENIFRPTPHGATLPRVKKRPSQVGITGVQPEKEKSTNQLTPCASEDPTSSEEHWCDMDESNPEPNLDGPHE